MKVYIYLAFIISTVCIAQMTGPNLNGNSNMMMVMPPASRAVKIPFYFTSPDNWMTFLNSISDAGHKCFLETLNSSATTFSQTGTIEDIKKEVMSKCSEYGTFINTMSQTVSVVPASDNANEAIREWRDQMTTIEKQLQRALATRGSSNETILKEYQIELAKSVAFFIKRLTSLSEMERRQLVYSFPRLQLFFSSSNGLEVLNKIGKLCEYFVSGKIDASALQTFVTTPRMMLGQFFTMRPNEVSPNDLMKVIGSIMSQVGNSSGVQPNVSIRPMFGVPNTTNRPMQESPKNTSGQQQAPTTIKSN